MGLVVICAVDEDYGFGLNGTLPWKCSRDLKHFAQKTKNNALIMGRNTWESLPKSKITKDRMCIVVTSQPTILEPYTNMIPVSSLHEAMSINVSRRTRYLIGGPQLITEAIQENIVNEAYVTYIKGKHTHTTNFKGLESLLATKFAEFNTDHYTDCKITLYYRLNNQTAIDICPTFE